MASPGERILVVESDPHISELIARQALKPLGYDVKVVDRASQAIEVALRDPPDLIIANLNLPDLGGKDVLAAISSQGVTAPLVVIAEKGEEHRAIQAFRLGAVDALLWPAKDAEIVQVVERAIQPTRSRRIRRQLYQRLEAAQGESGRRARDLAVIVSASKALATGTNEQQLFGRLLESALQIADADMTWLAVRDDRTGLFILRMHRNLPAAWAKKINQPVDDGLSSLVSFSGRALTIHGKPMEKLEAAALGRSAAVIPIKVRDEVPAVLVVIRRADVPIDKNTQGLLEALTDFVAFSLVRLRLARTLRAAAAAVQSNRSDSKWLMQSLQASIVQLQNLQSDAAVSLSGKQQEAVTAIQASLDRLMRWATGSKGQGQPPGG